MRNLFCAGLWRMGKSRAFHLALLAELGYTALVVLVCWDHCAQGTGNYTLEAILTSGFGLMGYLSIPSLIYAALLSVYLGTDYSDGTLRNKLIAGRTRTDIYLADLLTCVTASAGLDALFMLLAGALCVHPVLEMSGGVLLRVPMGQMLAWTAVGLLARAAWAAVVKLVVTTLGNRTAGAVAALLLLVVGAMVLCDFSFTQIESLSRNLADGLPVHNGEARLTFWQFLMDLLPTGQYLQVSRLYTPTLWRLPLLSVAVLGVSTGAGLLLFRRRNLK